MYDAYERTSEFATIAAIAEAIRHELGDDIEVCPGGRSPDQAEPLNRAFRAVARRILATVVAPGHDRAGLVSWTLGRLVRRRLDEGGIDGRRIKDLLELEPGSPDDWLAFLILIPWQEVLFWLDDADASRD